jgi:glucokinase
MILCGDIGGTKALLAVARLDEGRPHFVYRERYACADFPDVIDLLQRFREDAGAAAHGLAGGCLALAGPLADDARSAKITNLPWRVDAAACGALYGLPALRLANDFAAAALGVTAARPEDLVCLQTGAALASAPRLVIGAGTGLGMATLLPVGDGFRIVPGEGGHVGFSPQNAAQAQIHAVLLAEHGRVTAERVISGPGLAAIHRLLNHATLDPADIALQALADRTGPAARSLELFLAAYGAFAGDMALALLARGGVYLAGGIAAKILPALRDGPFLAAFAAKAEHAALAAQMPIHVATDPDLGLCGAALLCAVNQP